MACTILQLLSCTVCVRGTVGHLALELLPQAAGAAHSSTCICCSTTRHANTMLMGLQYAAAVHMTWLVRTGNILKSNPKKE